MPRREEYRLRPIEERDLETVLQWRNSDRIRANMYSDHFISQEEHQRWYRDLQEKRSSAYFVFEQMDRPIGMVYFTCIDERNGNCQWGFYLGETGLPKGTGTIMGFLGLEFGFESLKIRKLCGEVFGFNTASLKFFRRLGFREEGLFSRHVLKNGRFEDVVVFALFKEDWGRTRGDMEAAVFHPEGS